MNTILFQSANVLDVTSLQIKSGQDVWVENGLIKSVVPHQPDVFIASGTKVVKAQGKTLMPGLIDCHSHMATDSGVNEGPQAVTAEVRIGDFINAEDVTMYRQLAGGLTANWRRSRLSVN